MNRLILICMTLRDILSFQFLRKGVLKRMIVVLSKIWWEIIFKIEGG